MLLFQNNKNIAQWECLVQELNIDEIIFMQPNKLAEFITSDATELKNRIAIITDVAKNPDLVTLLEKIKKTIDTIINIKNSSANFPTIERMLYDFNVITVYLEIIKEISDDYTEIKETIKSQRLKEWFGIFCDFYNSERFSTLAKLVKSITENNNAKTIKSFTLGVNLDVSLMPTEVAIVSINDFYFSHKNIFTTFFKSTDENGAKYEFAAPIIERRLPMLQSQLYQAANKYIMDSLKKSQAKLLSEFKDISDHLIKEKDVIVFLLRAKDYVKKFAGKLCFPKLSSDTNIVGAFNPTLLSKVEWHNIVRNDIVISEDKNIFVITGANAGGKSVYVKTVGVMQMLFQLGLPVPAESASMKIMDCIFTHFTTSIEAGDSRFELECRSMKEILNYVTADSMLLMDESFSSTSSYEGAAVATQVIERLQHIGTSTFYSTHFHELTDLADSNLTKFSKVENMHVEMNNGVASYKVVFGSGDGQSFAYDIAKKYGLEFEQV